MDFFIVIISIILLGWFVIVIFLAGIIIKFLLRWFLLVMFLPISIYVGFLGGIFHALLGITIFIISIIITNMWQGSGFYYFFENIINKIFHFED